MDLDEAPNHFSPESGYFDFSDIEIPPVFKVPSSAPPVQKRAINVFSPKPNVGFMPESTSTPRNNTVNQSQIVLNPQPSTSYCNNQSYLPQTSASSDIFNSQPCASAQDQDSMFDDDWFDSLFGLSYDPPTSATAEVPRNSQSPDVVITSVSNAAQSFVNPTTTTAQPAAAASSLPEISVEDFLESLESYSYGPPPSQPTQPVVQSYITPLEAAQPQAPMVAAPSSSSAAPAFVQQRPSMITALSSSVQPPRPQQVSQPPVRQQPSQFSRAGLVIVRSSDNSVTTQPLRAPQVGVQRSAAPAVSQPSSSVPTSSYSSVNAAPPVPAKPVNVSAPAPTAPVGQASQPATAQAPAAPPAPAPAAPSAPPAPAPNQDNQQNQANQPNEPNRQNQNQPNQRNGNRGDDRPKFSFAQLIGKALLSAPNMKMLLVDIYKYFMDNYSYFKEENLGWKNSIRHNLSLSECFMKAERAEIGKGNYWTIHPDCVEDFKSGNYKRTRANRRAKQFSAYTKAIAIAQSYGTTAYSTNQFQPPHQYNGQYNNGQYYQCPPQYQNILPAINLPQGNNSVMESALRIANYATPATPANNININNNNGYVQRNNYGNNGYSVQNQNYYGFNNGYVQNGNNSTVNQQQMGYYPQMQMAPASSVQQQQPQRHQPAIFPPNVTMGQPSNNGFNYNFNGSR